MIICVTFWRLSFILQLYAICTRFILAQSCLSGCQCSEENDTALCCLISPSNASTPRVPWDACPFNVSSPTLLTWPQAGSCLSSWLQLHIRLTPSAWSVSQTTLSFATVSCADYLEKLIITGSSSADDGLISLNHIDVRNLLFSGSNGLRLKHLVIQLTQLEEIESGFFDQLRAFQLLDLEIIGNPHLTSDGLKVGCFVGLPRLRLLNLSRNRLTSVDLAKWGFAANRPSDLLSLDLSGNQIFFLKPRTFHRVPNLMKLDLSDNLLSSLPLTVFSGLDHLRVLNLQGNRLTLPGLRITSSSLGTTLPNLRHLHLSQNPLLVRNGSSLMWWLNSNCPTHLHHVNLERLTSQYPPMSDVRLGLPPIAWKNCPSLSLINLSGITALNCVAQQWLDLPVHSVELPKFLEIVPRSMKLCPPSGERVIESVKSNFKDDSTVSETNPIKLNAADGPPRDGVMGKDTDPERVMNRFKSHDASLESWILVILLGLLFALIISILAWGLVYWIRRIYGQSSQKPKLVMLTEPLNSPMLNDAVAFRGVRSSAYRPASVLSSKYAYSPLNRSMDGNLSDYAQTHQLSNQAPLIPRNHSDSGMGDSTPQNTQDCLTVHPPIHHLSNPSVHAIQTFPLMTSGVMRPISPSFASVHSFRPEAVCNDYSDSKTEMRFPTIGPPLLLARCDNACCERNAISIKSAASMPPERKSLCTKVNDLYNTLNP